MATGIRQKRIGRGASSTTGSLNVRSAPTMQNTVIPKRGVVSYNPLAGLGAAGAQHASRVEAMGRDVNNFFKSLSGSAMKAADIEHRKELVNIKEENERQVYRATRDEIKYGGDGTSMPGLSPKEQVLLNDRDYYDTRLKIRAQNHASESGAVFNEQLNNLPFGSDFLGAFETYATKAVEGMDPHYSTYFLAALRDKVKPEMDSHITDLVKADEVRLREELGHRIRSQAGQIIKTDGTVTEIDPTQVAGLFNKENTDTLIRDARKLLPGTMTDGQVKSFIIYEVMKGGQHAQNADHVSSHILTQLASDVDFGDGQKTFKQLHPEAFVNLSAQRKKITNEQFNAKDSILSQEISGLTTQLGDKSLSLTEALNQLTALPNYASLRHSPAATKTRAAYTSFIKAATKISEDGAPLAAFNTFANSGVYNRPVVKKLDKQPNSITAPMRHTLLGSSQVAGDFPNLMAAMTQDLTNSALVQTPNPKNDGEVARHQDASIRATVSASVFSSRIADGSLSRGEVKKLVGRQGYAVVSRYAEEIANGANPQDAITRATSILDNAAFLGRVEAIQEKDIQKALTSKNTGSNRKTWSQHISNLASDVDGYKDVNIPLNIMNEIVDRTRHQFAMTGQTIDFDSVKEVINTELQDILSEYTVVKNSDNEEGELVPNSAASEAQRSSLFKIVDGKSGVSLFSKALQALRTDKKAVAPRSSLAIAAGGSAPLQDRPNWMASLFADGTFHLNTQDRDAAIRGAASVINSQTGERIVFGPDSATPYNLAEGINVPSHTLTRDDGKTLTIIPDNFLRTFPDNRVAEAAMLVVNKKIHTNGEDAWNAGGVVTMSNFVKYINEHKGQETGFSLMPRTFRGETRYTLEYDSTVLTDAENQQALKALADKYRKDGAPLSMRETVTMKLAGVKTDNVTPKDARAALVVKGPLGSQVRQNLNTTQSYDYGIPSLMDWVFGKDWGGSYLGGLLKVGSAVGNNTTSQAIDTSNKKVASDSLNTEFKAVLDGVIKQGKKNGTVSQSLGVTTFTVPDKIDSVEQLLAVTEKLIHTDGVKSKAGLPNEPLGTEMQDTYINTRNKLITSGEGIRFTSYLDTSKHPSTGIGFKLDDPVIKPLAIKLLGKDKYELMVREAYLKPKDRTVKLTQPQMDEIFEAAIAEKEAMVSTWYKDVNLTPMQRAVVVDLAYQGGSLFVGPSTDFFKAVSSGDWDTAIEEIRERSNLRKVAGIQTRMDHRADLLTQAKTTNPHFGRTELVNVGEGEIPTTDWFDGFIAAINPISSAQAGPAQAAINPNKIVKNNPSEAERNAFGNWFDRAIEVVSENAKTLQAHAAQNLVSVLTPTDSLEMLTSDWLLKGRLGIDVSRKVMTERDIKSSSLVTLRSLARKAMAQGRTSITWDDYGTDIFGAPIAGIIGDKGVKAADKVYPKSWMGFLKLGVATMLDSEVDMAMTIGQGSLHTNEHGNVILTDTYDIERFKKGSASKGIYGSVRNHIGQEGQVSLESDPDSTKIKWRINLGRL